MADEKNSMIGFLKRYLKNRLFNILISDTEFRRKFFQSALDEYKGSRIDFFKKKYNIHDSFRFNGEMILFYGEGYIEAGEYSYVSDYSMLQSYKDCKIIIGRHTSISSNVRIFTQTNIADQDFNTKEIKIKTGDVVIGDNVWIGANVVINPGIRIGNNAIVGANSVVTKDIPEFSIYGGVPAKLIRMKAI